MSLPTSEPLPSEEDELTPARRRRRRRMIGTPVPGQHTELLDELARRVVPSIDFFLFSLLSGIVIGLAILFDSQALFVLAALVSPFMAPAVGLSLATVVGSWSFFLQSLAGFSVGSLLVLIAGMLAGWLVPLTPALAVTADNARLHAQFTWPDFIVLTLGAILIPVLLMRMPRQKPLAASIAVAYELYLPLGVAGFGITSGVAGLWPDALVIFFVHLAWAALVGTVTLLALGLRPFNLFGYALSTSLALAGIAALIVISGLGIAMYQQEPVAVLPETPTATVSPTLPQPTVTLTLSPAPPTATAAPTSTPAPTRTPTQTSSPEPTAAPALIKPNDFGGAVVRTEPDYQASVVRTLGNNTEVEILPETMQAGNITWVKIRMEDGAEGWIVRSLLVTATPLPQ